MAAEDRRRYLFVAIDRATFRVFARIHTAQTAANARRFLRDLERAAPMKITRVLTDNAKAFIPPASSACANAAPPDSRSLTSSVRNPASGTASRL